MSRRRWGLNFICDAPNFDYNKARARVDLLRPDWLVVINGLSFAKEIAAKYPQTNVIVRWVSADDDTMASWPKPADFIKWANQEFQGARLWANVSNECGFYGDLLSYTNDVIDQSGSLRLAVGGFSVGTPEPRDWYTPLAVEFLRRLDQNRGRVVLSLHEYYPALPIAGMDGIDHTITNMAGWPQDIRNRKCWLAGRYQFVIHACQFQEIGTPNVVITEHETDRIDQFKAFLDSLIKTPPYTEIRGFNTLTNQYRVWYNKDAQKVLADFNRYSDKVIYHHPAVVGITPFAACSNESEWKGFNLMDADDTLHGMAELNNAGDTPIPLPAPARKYAPATVFRYEGSNVYNIRAEATKTSADIGDFKDGDYVTFDDVNAVSADDHLWQRGVVYPSIGPARGGAEIAGWLAVDLITLTEKPIETEPPVPPVIVFTADQLIALAVAHEAVAAAHDAIALAEIALAEANRALAKVYRDMTGRKEDQLPEAKVVEKKAETKVAA